MSQKVSRLDMKKAQEIVGNMQVIKMLCVQAQSYSDTLLNIKFRYHKVEVNLNLYPEYIAELWEWPLEAANLEQFHTRALRFARMAEAHAIWLATNVED